MDIKNYGKMVNAVDKSKEFVGDTVAEMILQTMQSTFEIVEDYCKKSIPEFERRGRVVSKIYTNMEELTQDIDILYDGKPLEETEQSKHVEIISNLLLDSYDDIGWEEQ